MKNHYRTTAYRYIFRFHGKFQFVRPLSICLWFRAGLFPVICKQSNLPTRFCNKILTEMYRQSVSGIATHTLMQSKSLKIMPRTYHKELGMFSRTLLPAVRYYKSSEVCRISNYASAKHTMSKIPTKYMITTPIYYLNAGMFLLILLIVCWII